MNFFKSGLHVIFFSRVSASLFAVSDYLLSSFTVIKSPADNLANTDNIVIGLLRSLGLEIPFPIVHLYFCELYNRSHIISS